MTTLFVIKHSDWGDIYFAYNYGNIGWDGDGYFWTSLECLKSCLQQNVPPHRFAFASHQAAKLFAEKEFPENSKYEIVAIQLD